MYIPSHSADAEFQEVAKAMGRPQPFILLATSYAAPSKPQDGMIVKADGTHWDPGSGAGFYGYSGSAWVLLG
jgi:hypothetical protein